MKRTNRTIIIGLILCLVIGSAVGIAGGYGGVQVSGIALFSICALLAFAVNWLAFIPANMAQTEKYYDLTGGISYLSVITVALILTPELDTRAKLVAVMVILWTVRLAGFLFMRICQDGHDGRFDEIKIRPLRFFFAWTLQGLWVLLTVSCALVIITSNVSKPIGMIGSIGVLMWLTGFLIESVADAQKRAFKRDPQNKDRFITTGLWAWCQQPNYFGEILLWFGVMVMALPILQGWQWACVISPFFVMFLLTKVSGIPMLREKADKKWGEDSDYHNYVANTPVLIPMPPKKAL